MLLRVRALPLVAILAFLFMKPGKTQQSKSEDHVQVSAYKDGVITEDVDVIPNQDVNLVLECKSSVSPPEWVFNNDLTEITAPGLPCRPSEWTERWDSRKGHLLESFVRLKCKNFTSEFELGCRAATNHSDNVLVHLEPNHTTGLVHISRHRGEWEDEDEEIEETDSGACVTFVVAQAAGGTYWGCVGPDGATGSVRFHTCDAASTCANVLRTLKKMPVCHTVRPNLTLGQISTGAWVAWDASQHMAGVAACRKRNGQYERGGLEFFFVGKERTKPHFSMAGISMRDMLWFTPLPPTTTYYTPDSFNTRCIVPEYGFAFYPRLWVTIDGSAVPSTAFDDDFTYVAKGSQFVKDVHIDFQAYGYGSFELAIVCSAGVWNTTEWVNQTLTLQVRNPIPPSFEQQEENVTFQEGQLDARLECDAQGDPMPDVEWSHEKVHGVHTEGRTLSFTSAPDWANGSSISCTATNRFGGRAIKTFRIHVNPSGGGTPDSGISTTTIVSTVVLVLIALLFIGLGYMAYRFVRFGQAIARVLSDEEEEDFLKGKPGQGQGQGIVEVERPSEETIAIDCLPYNPEHEVPKEDFSVDFKTPLGSGQYGVVYPGYIKRAGRPLRVAVKTVRPNVPIEYFKALMSELKVLAHIGQQGHEHVVKLIGAYSSNIKQRVLWVGVEFCKTSLLQHLRDNSCTLKNMINPQTGFLEEETCFNEPANDYLTPGHQVTGRDLIRWAKEVAAGMEFLSGLRVVHGDLAARNVLLSFDLRAKICDFGLARQLVDYTYIKSSKCNLPWRWMAIESLRQMHFSTMSDVWSYGVTCWEIFSLGDVPYPCMAWSWEFVDQLARGKRLAKPNWASHSIFAMMLRCWQQTKERRPCFADLKEFFKEQEQQVVNTGVYANTAG